MRHVKCRSQARKSERGAVLIVALLALALMSALGVALLTATIIETGIASSYRASADAAFAADAAVEYVMQELRTLSDWNTILAGITRSAFVDGPPRGQRTLSGGSILDLTGATNMLNCGQTSICSDAEMDAYSDERPWGHNNPRWTLYAHGWMRDMIPTDAVGRALYVVVWVADDPAETDCDPHRDGAEANVDAPCHAAAAENPGRGVLVILAHGLGPGGVRRTVEVTVARSDESAPVRILSWRDVRTRR